MSARLQDTAMIAKLRTGQYWGLISDNDAAQTLHSFKHASDDAGKYVKVLLSKQNLRAVSAAIRKIKKIHKTNTLYWGPGEGLLPNKNHLKYTSEMQQAESELSLAVVDLCTNINSFKAEAMVRLGDMYNDDDYPDADELVTKFKVRIDINPIPDGDFRISVQGVEIDKLKKQYEDNMKADVNRATGDVWQRLYKAAQRFTETLGDGDKGFHKTMISQASELCDLLPSLNINDDPELDKLAQEVKDRLTNKYDAKELRNSVEARTETADAAKEIMEKIAGFAPIQPRN